MKQNKFFLKVIILLTIQNNLLASPYVHNSPCSNFYEYTCAKEKNSFLDTSDKEFILFTEKFRAHIKQIKNTFNIDIKTRNNINNFKNKCLEKKLSEKICERAVEYKFLNQYFISNKNKIIGNSNSALATLNKIYFDLKNIALEKIKNSSKFCQEEKESLANKISQSELKFSSEELISFEQLEYLSEEELSNKMNFLYSSPFILSSSSNIQSSWLLLYLTSKKEPFANQYMVIHILSHEIAHIILEHSSNLNLYEFAKQIINEFSDNQIRNWETHIPQNDIKSYSMYTASENISDRLGIEIALQYIKNKGYSSYKKFFKAFGQVHCTSSAKEKRPFFINHNSEQIINLDLHAKSIDRVNINLRHFEEFSNTFKCSNTFLIPEKNNFLD